MCVTSYLNYIFITSSSYSSNIDSRSQNENILHASHCIKIQRVFEFKQIEMPTAR